ncbi:hypothetical protein [Leptospira santarosai]|uniref:hypothetical protein n=1 Tax=Leptospira santarosai TaxID=28183 RepID=UPI0002DC73DE|nr:hypothetical protein [Leptospira santarosai]
MKKILFIAVFLNFFMMIGFLHLVPSWKIFFQRINTFVIPISYILLLYLVFRTVKIYWKRSRWLTALVTTCLASLGFSYYSFFFILNQLGDGGPVCSLQKVIEYPIDESLKTLYILHYGCIPNNEVVFKIRKGAFPILKKVDYAPKNKSHSRILRVSDSYGDIYGYDPIQNNYWRIFK